MQKKLSKENLSEFAYQAVNSLKRLVGSGGDHYTPAQQDLLSSSRQVEERWHQRRMPVDAGTVEMWCTGLRDELLSLTSPRNPQDGAPRKPLPESAMVSALETARILSRTTRLTAMENFVDCEVVPLLVKYFMTIPLSKKLRDLCALVLSEIPGDQSTLMMQCVDASLPFLLIHDSQPASSAVTDAPSEKGEDDAAPSKTPAGLDKDAADGKEGSTGALTGSGNVTPAPPLVVDSRAVYLAALLVNAIHRADAVEAAEMMPRDAYPVDTAVELLRCAHRIAMAPAVVGNGIAARAAGAAAAAAGAGADSDGYQTTAVTVYLSVVSGLIRGNTEAKARLTRECREMLCQTWCAAVANLGQMDTILSLSTGVPGKDALMPLLSSQTWQSELLELLIELITDDSFTLRRLSVYGTMHSISPHSPSTGGGVSGDGTPSSAARSPGLTGSPTNASVGVRRFEPVPAHWDTLLTGGSALVWSTASRLSTCLIQPDAVGTLEQCLLSLDTGSVFAESIYRNIIASLMLLCVADPHNAQRLADNAMFECLFALVTNTQRSVFLSEVPLPLHRSGDGGDAAVAVVTVSPSGQQLTTNTTQLTESFMCSLAAAYFPRELVQMLMRGVGSMPSGHTCQTDADVVESLLHVLSTTFKPPLVLFFPGCGSVTCKVDSFPGRWTGYSFVAWVNPMCVWAEGSHLFSFSADAGAAVTLSIVANGRSCCLALHVRTTKEQAMAVIPESNMAAETWSHIAFTQGLSGVSVFVNGRRLPSANVSVPFPQVPSKRHRLDLAFGGLLDVPSFYGYVASMELLEEVLSERDVGKLCALGPSRCEAAGFHPMLSLSPPEMGEEAIQEGPLPVSISGSLLKRRDGVSVHSVVALRTPDMQAVFAECGVMEWALQTLRESHGAANFSIVAKLCILFIATAMRMADSDAELQAALGSADGAFLRALTAEVLTWDEAFLEFPSIMLSAATPRGGGKVLRDHSSTQAVLSLLLDRLEVVCGLAPGGDVGTAPSTQKTGMPTTTTTTTSAANASNSAATSGNHLLSRNVMSACSILRELSDCLLLEENVQLFKLVAVRFDRILKMSLYLPPECIESVVVLVEKLCKCQPDLERTLCFLVQATPPATSSGAEGTGAAPSWLPGAMKAKGSAALQPLQTSSNTSLPSFNPITNADVAKAEILRMLFDVARADVSMCDMIAACFKGTGSSFLILLVNGKNHASEAVRVFALRLLSLMLHVNRKLREGFVKSHGFVVLSRAITDPRSRVPIRLPTVNCLFQMAFDGYRPTDGADAAMASRLSATSPTASKGKSKKARHQDVTEPGGGLGRNLGLPGHLPGLVSRRLKVTRREYSFEVAHDFARVDDRLQFDEAYRSRSAHNILQVPPAFETALSVLGSLITAVGVQPTLPAASGLDASSRSAQSPVTGAGAAGGADWGCGPQLPGTDGREDSDWMRRHGSSLVLTHASTDVVARPGGGAAGSGGDGNSSASAHSPMHEEEPPERVVARVLSYLEKVTDVEQNDIALLQYPWMDWLWGAVQVVAAARRGSSAASPASPAPSGRFTKKFSSMVMSHVRRIIRKLVVLDMTRNSKAASIRRLRGIQQPPYLLRIVLEEVVRHFIKGKQEEMSAPRGASNVIRNLDTLFHNIEYTLDPLPLALGTEIVGAISAIAVRNNSWVRMHMKKDSDLFEIRDRLAFFLLISLKRCAKSEAETLQQLVDANSNDLGTAVILLYRLSKAVDDKNLEEVEVVLLLIRRLTTYCEDQLREIYRQLGDSNTQLAELLCVVNEETLSSSSRQATSDSLTLGGGGGASLQRSNSTNAGVNGDPASASAGDPPTCGGGAAAAGAEDASVSGSPLVVSRISNWNPLTDEADASTLDRRLPISQVVDWCRTHEAQWASIANDCRQRALKLMDTHHKVNRDRVEKEHSGAAKATRNHLEHQQQLDAKVSQELVRIRAEVEAELGVRPHPST